MDLSLPSSSLSILRSILSLSLRPRFLYFALFCLSPFSLALHTFLYVVSLALPSPAIPLMTPTTDLGMFKVTLVPMRVSIIEFVRLVMGPLPRSPGTGEG